MSFLNQSISAASFIPLSAGYRYDDNIDFKPQLYQYDEGYKFIHQPIFNGSKDVKFASESFFGITSAFLLPDLINDLKWVDPAELIFYTSLQAANGYYVTNINNILYASASSVGENEFFRISRNSDGTCAISQKNLYATIITDSNDFGITMTDRLSADAYNIQKFTFYTTGDNENYTIKTNFIIPEWSPYFVKPLERFLSFDDSNLAYQIKTIGMIKNDNYETENNYKFSTILNFNLFAIGFDGKVIWVKYYNDLATKFFNRTTDIKDVINDIYNNYLIEYPYKTEIDNISPDSGKMNVNLVTLKNILTPEYQYSVKKD
jgi:hypothetical protein